MEVQAEISLKKNRDLVGREIEVMVEGAAPGRATRLRARTSAQAPEIDGMVMLKRRRRAGRDSSARVSSGRLTYDLHGRITGAVA